MAHVISILCDECLESGSEVPGDTWGLSIEGPGIKAVPYTVDACTMHAEPLQALAKQLAEHGRRADRKAPLPRVSSASEPAAATVEALSCPVEGCTHVGATKSGLTTHLKRIHDTTRSALGLASPRGGEPGDYPCPECAAEGAERHFTRPQGLGRHRLSVHGVAGATARE